MRSGRRKAANGSGRILSIAILLRRGVAVVGATPQRALVRRDRARGTTSPPSAPRPGVPCFPDVRKAIDVHLQRGDAVVDLAPLDQLQSERIHLDAIEWLPPGE